MVDVIELELSRNDDTLALPLSATPGHDWCVAPGIEGLDLPASKLLQERAAGQFGSYPRGVDVDAREVFLPLMVRANTLTQMLALRTTYNRLTAPYHGNSVRITATRPDGSYRWIDGFRVGNAPVWDLRTWIPVISWQKFGQTFICPDPWWYSEPDVYVWALEIDSYEVFFPITPVELVSAQIIGQPVSLFVDGDVISYPKFVITGSATEITATHIDTGREWVMEVTLADDEVLIVDTNPRLSETPSVMGPDGSSWFQYMQPPYDLWSLPIGNQEIQVSVLGSSSATSVQMLLYPRWETA